MIPDRFAFFTVVSQATVNRGPVVPEDEIHVVIGASFDNGMALLVNGSEVAFAISDGSQEVLLFGVAIGAGGAGQPSSKLILDRAIVMMPRTSLALVVPPAPANPLTFRYEALVVKR